MLPFAPGREFFIRHESGMCEALYLHLLEHDDACGKGSHVRLDRDGKGISGHTVSSGAVIDLGIFQAYWLK